MEAGEAILPGDTRLIDKRGRLQRTILGAETGLLARLVREGFLGFALAYGLVMVVRNMFYNVGLAPVGRLPGPTVSVGNLTLGGTGKTPMAEWVAGRLDEAGWRPAVISRGYGAPSAGGQADESAVLARRGRFAHRSHPVRRRAARAAVEEDGANAFVLDDGFQHRRVARDMDIVLVDAAARPEGLRMFPSGTLREPFGSLKRADAVVITHADICRPSELATIRRKIRKVTPDACLVEAAHRPISLSRLEGSGRQSAETLGGRKVFALCGIGHPDTFLEGLRRLGARVVGAVFYPDHHDYTETDCAFVRKWAEKCGAELCITTWKDAVKLRRFWDHGPLRVLEIRMQILRGEKTLLRGIHERIGARDECRFHTRPETRN